MAWERSECDKPRDAMRRKGSMPNIGFRSASKTDMGIKRGSNEDCHVIQGGLGLFILADGMGGHNAGEVASALAVRAVQQQLAPVQIMSETEMARALERAVLKANEAVFQAAVGPRKGMGTTLVVALVYEQRLFVACVGDSRAYLRRGDRLVLITRDQNGINDAIDCGMIASEEDLLSKMKIKTVPPMFLALTQYVGMERTPKVALTVVDLRRDDELLLCSDGLTNERTEAQIAELLEASPTPQQACAALVAAANAAGGHDNITVIVTRFDGDDLPPSTPQDVADLKREPYVLAPNAV